MSQSALPNGTTPAIRSLSCLRRCLVKPTVCWAWPRKSWPSPTAGAGHAGLDRRTGLGGAAGHRPAGAGQAGRLLRWLASPHQDRLGFTKARIRSIDDAKVRKDLNAGKVVIITGFQGVDADGNITTLGRGGSDTSAVAVPPPSRRRSA
jgi:hypothetical protein